MSDTLDLVSRSAQLAGAEAVDRLLKSLESKILHATAHDSAILTDALRRIAPPATIGNFEKVPAANNRASISCVQAFAQAIASHAEEKKLSGDQLIQAFIRLVRLVEKPANATALPENEREEAVSIVRRWFDGLLTNFRPPTPIWG